MKRAKILCPNIIDPMENIPSFDTADMSADLKVIVDNYKDNDGILNDLGSELDLFIQLAWHGTYKFRYREHCDGSMHVGPYRIKM